VEEFICGEKLALRANFSPHILPTTAIPGAEINQDEKH
jgi:hypothetical protein